MTEKILSKRKNGMAMLLVLLAGIALGLVGFFWCIHAELYPLSVLPGLVSVVCMVMLAGLKVLRPQEALVLTLFGIYVGSLKGEGFYWVNPFCSSVNPAAGTQLNQSQEALVLTLFGIYVGSLKGEGFYWVNPFCSSVNPAAGTQLNQSGDVKSSRAGEAIGMKMSLKIMTLSNNKQKINDCLGNPVEIGIAVMWRVVDTAKAAFNVDNYKAFLSLQCDSALRNIVRLYPYDAAPNVDTTGDGLADDGSLRGSSEVVAQRIKEEIQARVEEAGLEIVDARITYLAYAPEIAAVMLQRQQASAVVDARKLIVDGAVGMVEMALEVMLQRQQASAVVDARKLIVDGAVGMVEMALERLQENGVVDLDEERKAAMVSNLLVVLCGNKDAQPIVNSGSLY